MPTYCKLIQFLIDTPVINCTLYTDDIIFRQENSKIPADLH